MIHKIIIALLAALLPLSFMLGVGIGAMEESEEPSILATEATNVYRCQYGEKEIVIETDPDHFVRLSDHTVIITDRALPEVEKEIRFVRILEE